MPTNDTEEDLRTNQNPYFGARQFFGYVLLAFVFGTCGWSFLTLPVADEPATQSFYTVIRVVDVVILAIFLLLYFAEAFYKPADEADQVAEAKQDEGRVANHQTVLTMENLQQQERLRDMRAREARAQKTTRPVSS